MDLFRAQGFDATSMEQIAEAADIAKGTLYNHYPAKEAIIGAYMQGTVRELEPEMDRLLVKHTGVRCAMRSMAERMALWVEKDSDFVARHIRYRMANAQLGDERHRTGFESVVARAVRSGQEQGEIRSDLPAPYLTRSLYILFSASVITWLTPHESLSLKEALFRDIDLFLEGAAPGGKTGTCDSEGGGEDRE